MIVDNDASVAALACFLHGAFQSADAPRDLLYVRVVDGIGAGVVLQGRLIGGADGLAGEIGHFQVSRGGPLCPGCGRRGCLETIASTRAIQQSLLSTGRWEEGSSTLDAMLKEEHPAVDWALREAGNRVGIALSNAANLLNPRVIYLGGPLRGRESFRQAMGRAMSEYALEHSRPALEWHPDMRLAPELTGAAARAAVEFFDRLLWQVTHGER